MTEEDIHVKPYEDLKKKGKCTNQQSPYHKRPLKRFLLKCYDILALSNKITLIISSKGVRSPPRSSAEAAVSKLHSVLLSSRPAREKANGLLITNSLSVQVVSAGKRSCREKTKCSAVSLLLRKQLILQVSEICRFLIDKNNRLLFVSQKLLESTRCCRNLS